LFLEGPLLTIPFLKCHGAKPKEYPLSAEGIVESVHANQQFHVFILLSKGANPVLDKWLSKYIMKISWLDSDRICYYPDGPTLVANY